MITQRKTQIILALMVTSVFLFQNCATIISGTSQKIPVTSNPSGAKIIVDGKVMGYTPLQLKLKKKKSYTIQIEKQGYNPLEIRITRKTSGSLAISILGNVFFGCLGMVVGLALAEGISGEDFDLWYGDYPWQTIVGLIAGGVYGWGGSIYKDFKSGANYKLSPKELNVTLSKIEGSPQPNLILLDAEHFKNIKWIRIKCADSDGEEVINLE